MALTLSAIPPRHDAPGAGSSNKCCTYHHSSSPPMMVCWCDIVLRYAGQLALATLVAIYCQAAFYGDLWSDPNWTISNVMVYSYNQHLTNTFLFPCFFTLCVFYSLKLDHWRVRLGSAVAITGGVGLMIHPVNTHQLEHKVFALVTFLSSWFWYPQCTDWQFRYAPHSSVAVRWPGDASARRTSHCTP
eukprot:COSAG01_NODE_14081_length_1498_cov_1.721944_2_plen_188_part_00